MPQPPLVQPQAAAKAMSHRPPARLLIETLEPRILYSADLMPLAAGTNAPNITEQRILTPADSNTTSHELVFIDARVDGYQSLIDNIVANTTSERPIEIIVITADEDGVSRISETLASRQGISAIHLISHGDAGRIQLGNAWLDNQQLLQRADEIARWGNAMGGESDFLIYGCDVAASDAGKTLLANLAHLTGADVAASNDLTGSAARGGDWTLEVSTGSIETGTLTENTWNGLLAANTAPSFNIGDGLSAFVSGSANGVATRITYQSDGKYLMSGYVLNGANYDMTLARYNADGTLDTSFNGTGQVITTVSTGNDYGNTVKVQTDGKIVVVGYASNGVNDDIVVLRYNADGTLDTSFNGIGGVITAIGLSDDRAVGLALQSDGKIVVAGLTAGATLDFALVRYNSNGTLDTSFNGTGIVVTAVGGGDDWGWDVAVQSDGKIVVTGQSSNGLNQDVALLRYNSNGTLDTSFNSVGGVTTAIGAGDDYGNNVTLQSDGKIIVGGYSFNGGNYDAALLRYNSNGTLDTSFNGTGKFTISLGTGNDHIWGVAVQSDGKIVAVGQSITGTDSDIAVLRLNTNGTLDTSFNGTGIRKSGIAGNNDGGLGVEVLSDGRIAVGCYSALGADASFIVLRLNADGSPDLTLDAAAAVPFTEGGSAVVLNSGLQLFDAELSALNNFNGATLTLARNGGANSQDVFSASGTLGALTQGGNLVVGGTIIGTVTTNASGTLLLTFNANATNTLVNSAMQQIAYSNSSDAPPASVQIDWTFNDGNTGSQGTGGALTATSNSIVSITAVNTPPVLTLNGSTTVSIDEGQVVMPFYARISTTDADSADFNGGTLTVSISSGQQAADELYITGGNIAGVTVSGNNVQVSGVTIGTWAGGTGGTPLTVTFNANAILSSVDTLLNVITYTNTSNAPVSGARIISVSVSDGDGGTSNTVTGNVTLSAINNPPASTGGSVTGTEDTALVFNWSDFNVSDVDTAIGADSAIRITSMPANGSLQYFDGSTWISASLNQVFTKARIDAGYLRFMPAQDQSGSDTNANPGLGNGFNDYAQFGFEPLQTTAIAINNPDAEANIYPDGNWSNTATGWTVQGPAGSQNPAAANFPLDNDNTLFTDAGGSLEQTLGTTFSSSNNYSLSLEVGSTYASGTYSFEVQIYAGSTQIGVMNQSNFTQINSQFVSGTLTIDGSSYAALDGQALQIRLVGLTAQAFYDNLTLSSYVRASDIGSGATMNIDIVAVNDAPSITSNGGGTTANVNVAENQTAVTTVTATDPDAGATQTYSISGGADAALFSINSTTGVLTFNSGQNFESTADANADGIYEVTVQVSDGQGGSDTQAISVTVTNVNESTEHYFEWRRCHGQRQCWPRTRRR